MGGEADSCCLHCICATFCCVQPALRGGGRWGVRLQWSGYTFRWATNSANLALLATLRFCFEPLRCAHRAQCV